MAEDKLVLAPVAQALSSEARYTAREIAERAGVDLDFLAASRRALGLPVPADDERIYGEKDLEAARLGHAHRQVGFDDEDALEVARVLGQGMARYAEATRALVARTFIEPGLDEYELAHRYRAVAEQLMPLAGPWLEHVFALHLQQVLRSDALTQEQRRAGKLDDTQDAVIAFADLVGFTELGESVPVEELGSVAGRLSPWRASVEPPVKFVKLIGDAVMLVSPEPEPMFDVHVAADRAWRPPTGLAAAARGRSPAARRCTAGATGSARRSTSRAGTARARPSTVLVAEEIRDRSTTALRVLRRRPQEAQGLLRAGPRLPRREGRRCSASSAWALAQTASGAWCASNGRARWARSASAWRPGRGAPRSPSPPTRRAPAASAVDWAFGAPPRVEREAALRALLAREERRARRAAAAARRAAAPAGRRRCRRFRSPRGRRR